MSHWRQWAAVRTCWYDIKTPPHHTLPVSIWGANFTQSSNDNFIITKNGYKFLFLTSVPLKILRLGFLYLAWKIKITPSNRNYSFSKIVLFIQFRNTRAVVCNAAFCYHCQLGQIYHQSYIHFQIFYYVNHSNCVAIHQKYFEVMIFSYFTVLHLKIKSRHCRVA